MLARTKKWLRRSPALRYQAIPNISCLIANKYRGCVVSASGRGLPVQERIAPHPADPSLQPVPWRAAMESGQPLPRVLSVQSHVVHGYVGNKCAVFPLQILGLEVDPIYSVQFSNHTGYPTFKGSVFDGSHLRALVEGLRVNGLLTHTHLLTGYTGSESLLQGIADLCTDLRNHSPDLTFVCDPVLGDEGRMYVTREHVDVYRTTILPLASVLVPNQFEAELLLGPSGGDGGGDGDGGGLGFPSIDSLDGAVAACEALMTLGPHTVVITSLALPGDPEGITLVAATRLPQRPDGRLGGATRMKMRINRIKAYFTGTGDLFAALLLAWMHHHPGDLAAAVEKAVGGLQAVLADTVRHCGPAGLEAERTAGVCALRELRLIPCQSQLQDPPIRYRCEALEGGGTAGREPAAEESRAGTGARVQGGPSHCSESASASTAAEDGARA